MADLVAMVAPFADEELHTFQGAGGKQLTYIEDETVMDRLDIGFGRGNWSVAVEAVQGYEGVVKVTLAVRTDPDSESDSWVDYADFGYPNNKDGQSLKEAVSDGIRRCGRYLGIARDLYRKDAGPRPTNGQSAPTPRITTRAALELKVGEHMPAISPLLDRRSSTVVPEPPLDWDVLDKSKPASFQASQAAKIDPDGAMTFPQLADRAKALSVPTKVLGDTAKRLFGPNAWKLTDLTDVQRYAVAVEVGLL